MKRFIIRIGLFFVLLLAFDRVIGYALQYMSDNARGGYLGHQNYILKECKDDILIFGSSRAIHHYNAPMIQDSLKVSCYNCGQDGEGIIMYYGWWQLIKQNYSPKVIIYEVFPPYDVEKGDNAKHLGWLKLIYDNKGIQQEFEDIDPKEKYKMLSLMYRYNSRFHQILLDYIHPVHSINRGYLPVYKELDTLQIRRDGAEETGDYKEIEMDTLKFKYLERILTELDDTKMVFILSPTWYGKNEQDLTSLRNLAMHNNCDFYDFTTDSSFVHHSDFFYDGYHLNSKGADKYTQKVVELLRSIVSNNSLE